MPEYLAPGVFIEEIERGPRPIEGVATSTAAFLGETERGRTKPRLVTSFNEYRRHFGSAFAEGKYMPYALSGFFDNGGRRAYVCRIVGPDAAAATRTVGGLRIDAIGPGAWGDRVFVKLVGSTTTTGPNKDPVGFRLQVAYWQTPTSDGSIPIPSIRTQPRRLPRPTMTEDFDNLVFDDRTSPDFFEKRLEDNSALVAVSTAAPGPIATLPAGTFGPLAGGADGTAPTVVDFKGENTDSNLRAGLSALELDEFREVALVTAPAAPNDVVDAVRTHCERSSSASRSSTAPGTSPMRTRSTRASDFDTTYAAFYYPWIYTADLQSGAQAARAAGRPCARRLRPHRHRARRVQGAGERGPARRPRPRIRRRRRACRTSSTRAASTPSGASPGAASASGARARSPPTRCGNTSASGGCSSSSSARSTKARSGSCSSRTTTGSGRASRTRSGCSCARSGATARCSAAPRTRRSSSPATASTMTQDDILNGRLICEIGIAPVRPAEFVIFRIFQNTAEAQRD